MAVIRSAPEATPLRREREPGLLEAACGRPGQQYEHVERETVAARIACRAGCAWRLWWSDAAASDLGRRAPTYGADDRCDTATERWLTGGAANLDERPSIVLAGLGLKRVHMMAQQGCGCVTASRICSQRDRHRSNSPG
ncbi:hypothetical protein ACLBWJ_12170 [Microbacterium sp. M4A5_1d]